MIRFRNPGTQYTTQVQVFRELYKEYKDAPSFDLDDMAATIAKTKLMTAYGYAGDAALALSNTENDSLNSTKMNAKMYAEVFRLLGWVTSAGDNSYPLVFTYIGEHAALADDVLPLYEQCVLGINNPQEIMDVKYDEKVRFFKATLFSLQDLGGIMYKHELCLGPMHSRNNLGKKDNAALVVCLSFPNKRQGYFQVIKDIHRVLDLKIQTISLGALLLLVWNGAAVNFLSREFYVDFDNLSIRGITEFRLNRHVLLSEGKLGILEPEK